MVQLQNDSPLAGGGENLERTCVQISYALRRTDTTPVYAITHIVKPRERLLTPHGYACIS